MDKVKIFWDNNKGSIILIGAILAASYVGAKAGTRNGIDNMRIDLFDSNGKCLGYVE